jgi:lipopolysaccharide/colanic/teichoic acid biosynthesis glycosyltransferase
VALGSRGPVIFKQKRVGRDGVPFTFYKFRSMVPNGNDGIHREFVAALIQKAAVGAPAANDDSALYKIKADPRVTPVGRFIRRTSLDELPQLFNVLKGDMSLVGPRPPLPYESVQYQPWHLRRILSVKPGITGVWQVEGRSRVSFNDMVRMDLRYIRECSLATDLSLLVRTVRVVLHCKGAV